MALDSTHYATLQDIKGRAGISDAVDDATIEPAIKTASRAIDVHCGQFFYKLTTASARTFVPTSACLVTVDPFHTTTDLVIKSDSTDAGTFATTFASDDYDLERFGGDLAYVLLPAGAPYDTITAVDSYRFLTTNKRRRSVQVTAQWGWPSVPDNVTEATKIVAVDLWKRKDTPFGISTGTTEFGGGLRIGKDLLAQVSSLLASFVRVDRTIGLA